MPRNFELERAQKRLAMAELSQAEADAILKARLDESHFNMRRMALLKELAEIDLDETRARGPVPIRSAFTLLETVVVFAILAILLGLLLPAVAAVREISLQAQCSSHLHQLGVAAHSHVEVTGTYPREQMVSHTASLFTAMLPFVESDHVYTCPSRRSTPGKTDYCGAWSSTLGGGRSITDNLVSPTQIGAGTSNTLLMSHKGMQTGHYSFDPLSNDAGYAVTKDTAGGCDHMRCADPWGEGSSAKRGYTQDNATVDENHMGGPHPEASPVLYADGSVRSFSYSYATGGLGNVETWQALWAYDRASVVIGE